MNQSTSQAKTVRWARLIVWEGPEDKLDYENPNYLRCESCRWSGRWEATGVSIVGKRFCPVCQAEVVVKHEGQKPSSWFSEDGAKPAAGGTMSCIVLTDEDWDDLSQINDLVERIESLKSEQTTKKL